MLQRRTLALWIRAAIFVVFAVSGCQCNDAVGNNERSVCIDCDDPCAANPCAADRACAPAGDTYVCRCPDGLLDVDGACITDPCVAETCGDLANTWCVAEGGQAMCRCLPGHEEQPDGNCLPATGCSADTCGMRGVCVEADDGPECACDPGFAGRFCEACDTAAGFVEDGRGGCTDDPCSVLVCDIARECAIAADGTAACACPPGSHDEDGQCVIDTTCMANSCNGAGVCDDSGGQVTCTCDPGFSGQFCGACDVAGGYHDDGAGGCTMDECLPNPCVEPNKTMCTSMGVQQFECTCDTGFHDEGGSCVADEVCMPDSCNGHGMCDDSTNVVVCACDAGYVGEFCDQCDANAGYRPDGAGGCTTDPCTPNALPDDGFDCTVDTCPNNLAVHTPDDSRCDDGLWCTGVEICAPAAPNADARGCVSPAPPAPPRPVSPCQYYGACDEQSQSFPLLDRSAGDSCSDGIYCSTGDACDASGSCIGTLQAGCPSTGTCSVTTPLAAYDVVEAHINPTVTYDGQDPVAADLYTAFDVWAVSQENGTWTGIASYYGFSLSNPPTMSYGERLLPGVYDIMYTRTSGSGNYDRFILTDGNDDAIFGRKTLQTGVVIRAGMNDLVIDILSADINPTVTYDGQDPVAADLYTAFDVWAVSQENGTWTGVASYYGFSLSNPPTMSYGERLLPGTYDIMYTRTSGSGNYDRFILTDDNDDAIFGLKTLQTGVVISDSGPNDLVIDIPSADINPTVTYDGQDPVAADLYTAFDVWAVSQENGTWTGVASYYGFSLSNPPTMSYGERLLPGTYDIVYTRTSGSGNYDRFILTDGNDDAIFGRKTLQTGVVISDSGPNNLVIDIPSADINPTVTYDGQDPVAADLYTAFDVWAVSQENGTWTGVASYYGFSLSNPPTMSYGERLLPGTYDIMYTRTSGSGNYDRFILTDGNDDAIFGLKTLQTGVVISDSGPNDLVIDIPSADINPTVTYDGQDPVAADLYTAFDVWAVSQENGTWTGIASYYGFSLSNPPTMSYGERLLPGTYDIVYTRTSGSGNYDRFILTDGNDDAIFGLKTVQTGVVISDSGPNNLVIDIPSADVNPTVTYTGQDPVAADLYTAFDVWAVSRDSGTWTGLASYYGFSLSNPPTMSYGERLLPGTYDIMYTRTSGSGNYDRFILTDGNDDAVFGLQVLEQCVLVP